jgi:histidinol-phosphate/aromatic aminotransferase/cobyric acid decarboxylase-like protein/choline kinase
MQAIILAAGMGKRLGALTQHNTKCMITVNGITLIDRMLSQLSLLDLSRVIIVVGYEREKLITFIGNKYPSLNITYIENPIYDKTNNIYSLALTKEYLVEEDTLLLESDLIFDHSLLELILTNSYPNLALVSKYEAWMDGTMVTIDSDNNIETFVPKRFFRYDDIDSYYKTVNIYKFSKVFLESYYVPFLEAYSKAMGNNEYYEQVLRVITQLDKSELKALPLPNREHWYEIDDIQDLDIAETLFANESQKLEHYQQRYGGYWRFPAMLDFCYLVNPYFPPTRMKEEIKSNFDKLLTEYPSGMHVNSLLASKYFDVKQEYICVGNGAAELIKALMELFSGKIGVVYPTFEEYPNRKTADDIVAYIPDNNDFTYSVDDLIHYFDHKQLSSLLLINPDNPSGNFIPFNQLLRLLEWSKAQQIALVVDESFVDFTDDSEKNTLLKNELLASYPQLVVVKSISKSYGVPGLRLGVLACANENLITTIKKNVAIWNINSFGEFYMQIFGKYEQDYQNACKLFVKERERFYKQLQNISYLRVIPSQANFFLCEIVDKYTSNELSNLLLERYNILIKDCGTKKPFTEKKYIRIAVRDTADNDNLYNVLRQLSL